jgi:hypothetical protein
VQLIGEVWPLEAEQKDGGDEERGRRQQWWWRTERGDGSGGQLGSEGSRPCFFLSPRLQTVGEGWEKNGLYSSEQRGFVRSRFWYTGIKCMVDESIRCIKMTITSGFHM